MPYIKQSERLVLAPLVVDLAMKITEVPVGTNVDGRVNYAITKLIHMIYGKAGPYASFNAAIGALECAKQEYLRRHVGPYEDQKIKDNGDV